ncbi:MAG TPA: aquaporin [Bacteroidia bacterium]|nr:aquaporin [Bacteroidia bacterium]
MGKYIIEFIGTFFLVFVIALTTNDPQIWAGGGTPFAPLAIGTMLMVMVYMGGHISGAHYNPAVTLACWINKKIESKDAITYMIVQVIGAIAAALMFYFIFGRTANAPAPLAGFEYNFKPMLVEMFFTFALAMVVLNVAVSKDVAGNSYYGMAIGFTILASAYAGGPVSGGAFNPAVGIGPTLVSSMLGGGSCEYLWIYLVGPLAGGVLAAVVYKITNPKENQ